MGYTVKNVPEPSGFPWGCTLGKTFGLRPRKILLAQGHILPYTPPLVLIRIQYLAETNPGYEGIFSGQLATRIQKNTFATCGGQNKVVGYNLDTSMWSFFCYCLICMFQST